MNLFRRQQVRGFVVTLLTSALLIGAVGFTVIGYAAGEASEQQSEAIHSRYMTVGQLKEQETQPMLEAGPVFENDLEKMGVSFENVLTWQSKNYVRFEDGSIQWDDGTLFYGSERMEKIAAEAPQIQSINRSAILSAHVKGVYGLTSGSQNELQFNHAFDDHSYNFCVLVVRSLPDIWTEGQLMLDATEDGEHRQYQHNQYIFSNNWRTVSAHPYYEARLKKLQYDVVNLSMDYTLHWSVQDSDGSALIEPGKQYIMRGFLQDFPILLGVTTGETADESNTYGYYRFMRKTAGAVTTTSEYIALQLRGIPNLCFYPTARDLVSFDTAGIQEGNGPINFNLNATAKSEYHNQFYYTIPEDSLPYFTEFTGSVEDFLASEEGAVWRDVIIPMAELNQQAANVILTDNLDYLAGFGSGEASVIDGREIEPIEYEAGAKVCIVSSAYAQNAGVGVGDTLTLDFYDTEYYLTGGKTDMLTREVYDLTITHNPLQEANRIGYEQEYEIVGIYSAPEWEFGTQTFHADTIFVPKNSVPNAEEYENPGLPLLNSITIQNGTAEEFEAYMEEQGFGGYYQFFDHDYSSNIEGFEAMAINAQRLLLIGMVVLVVTAILFYYLNFRRMIPVAYNMRRLGHSRFHVWWQMNWVTIPLILLSVLGGAALGVYSFDYITAELLQTDVVLDMEAVKTIALAEAAALCIPALLVSIPICAPRLMKRK